MTCAELRGNIKFPGGVDHNRYTWLHHDGKKLIKGWFEKAWKKRNCRDKNSFEPFIYAWISFNGWASCVTGLDKDIEWRVALMENQGICDNFIRLINDNNSVFAKYAEQLYGMWPIFKAQEIRRLRVQRPVTPIRSFVVDHYFSHHIRKYEPKCWERHIAEGSLIPLDWPHTLTVLNRVRCNLFHGEKSPHTEMDAIIVGKSFKVLINFLDEAGYFI